MFIQTWLLPFALLATATIVAFPLSRYLAWIMDGKYRPLPVLRWFENRLDSGPQNWKQYTGPCLSSTPCCSSSAFWSWRSSRLCRSIPTARACWPPRTIFNSVVSFMTNTNLQHYAGDQHLSNFSQIFFGISNHVSVGGGRLVRTDRDHPGLSGRQPRRQLFLDMWRVLIYMFVPVALILGSSSCRRAVPMTFKSSLSGLNAGTRRPWEPRIRARRSSRTSWSARSRPLSPLRCSGTNGGGFFGMNSAHPFENPTGLTNFFNTLAMMLFPFALVLMYGRMLGRLRHALVIFSVMMLSHGRHDRLVDPLRHAETEPGIDGPSRGPNYEIPSAKAPGGNRR